VDRHGVIKKVALLTLGRFPKALTLARALKTSGWRVIVADPFKWHLCRASNAVAKSIVVTPPTEDADAFINDLLTIIDQENISLVLPISEESHYVSALTQRVAGDVLVMGPDEDTYRELHHKLRFIERAEKLALPVPETYMLGSVRATRLATLRETIIKPTGGCSGVGVRRHAVSDRPIVATGDGDIVQAAVQGQLMSSFSILVHGNLVSTAVYEGAVFSGSVAICFRRVQDTSAIEEWIGRFTSELSYTGFIAFDFIVDKSGVPWAIECNPRLTSGVHFLEPRALGRWLSDREDTATIAQLDGVYQWAYSTLTEAYSQLFKGQAREFIRHLKQLFSAKDVVFSWRDPLPFLLMTPLSWPILWPAIREGISLGEASQRDIAPHWHRE